MAGGLPSPAEAVPGHGPEMANAEGVGEVEMALPGAAQWEARLVAREEAGGWLAAGWRLSAASAGDTAHHAAHCVLVVRELGTGQCPRQALAPQER